MEKLVLFAVFMTISLISFAQVGIGVTSPDASAILDIESSNKGFLPPRLSAQERNDISEPAQGLTIFNTTENCLQWHVGGNAWHNACGGNTYLEYPIDTFFCEPEVTEIVEVTSSAIGGKVWMDRNLGASQEANTSIDTDAYGDMYQWGRGADGHQCRTSLLFSTFQATTAVPNDNNDWDGLFINTYSNWLDTDNTSLWQGVNGVNNPCPAGFRLPTRAEWENEFDSWTTKDASGAFDSDLKLPAGGNRSRTNGNIDDIGIEGSYWSSTTSTTDRAFRLLFNTTTDARMDDDPRATGVSIRCIIE